MKRIAVVCLTVLCLAPLACRRLGVNAPLAHMLFGVGGGSADEAVSRIRAPEGFSVHVFARDLRSPRVLRVTTSGDLLVSDWREGQVLLLSADRNGDPGSDGRRVLLDGLDKPYGLDVADGWLFVGETGALGRIRFDGETGETHGAYERVTDLPAGGNHWTRPVRMGPDGWLYVAVGSDCNACEEEDGRRAALLRTRPDGSDTQVFATGLRNSAGFDWQPVSGELYATDNGRDWLGDDFPPCELNRVVQGGFYGWPYANGNNVPDPDFGDGHTAKIAEAIPPAHGFRAHNAPLGMAFLGGNGIPPAYRGAAIVALHGSWNRSVKDGYKVVSLHWRADGEIEERDFLVGFLDGNDVVGRPVGVTQAPDGTIYVSDDFAGAIYRVTADDRP